MARRGRNLTIEWAAGDDAAGLSARYRRERRADVRSRLHALWLVRTGHTTREAAAVLGLDERTVQRWLGWYRAVADLARSRGCRRASLLTTNDNTPALRFYQRVGWDLVRLRHGAVDEWRRTVKPSIAERGLDGISISHALELEIQL